MMKTTSVRCRRVWKTPLVFGVSARTLHRAEVPEEIVDAIRLGRLTALQKPNGGVRGLVSGDVVRRLVARTIAQQLTPAVQRATSPSCVLFRRNLGANASLMHSRR